MTYTGPPIIYADHQREPFEWCQVAYLYANELLKKNVETGPAFEEGWLVVNALKPWGSPTPGTDGDRSELVVHWPTLICAANAYASLSTEQRLAAIDEMADGVAPAFSAAGWGDGGCERKALDDPEYQPAPPCVPQQAASAAVLSVAAFIVTAGLTWLWTRRPFRK